MAAKTATRLAQLRKTDLKPWATGLWLVKRRLAAGSAHYSVLRVEIDQKLQYKLKVAITSPIHNQEYKLEPYDFLTADQDDRLFTIDSAETDFTKIQAEIDKGFANKKAEAFEDLMDSWAYVVKLAHNGHALYGVRKISKYTSAAKFKAMSYFFFENKQLVDLEEKKVFTIDTHIDFFVYDGIAFITNKREFEIAMNFRQGMEANRDAVLADFPQIFSDVAPIRKVVGSNLHLLRKISAIQKSGYYKDKDFIAGLVKINAEEEWGLDIVDGVIAVEEANVDLVLTLLNNSRLKSPINLEVFDATVKTPVKKNKG